ncbi:mannosyltransferase putative-domain-containing protein [Polychytrium aggregatum]|uniref:mannosyltransferase putative-domain-containing protein n=1 Tax=Polychytrium aggregatum TaxID=110093 RepID=UPI0022FE14F9|nr:mannosyltransferase putative-domain-containing protein [Polychytrium aggregatum]KAI9192969.1 mannosyltransferase putative-domain-containing protein [Polychytrium aggregatum]
MLSTRRFRLLVAVIVLSVVALFFVMGFKPISTPEDKNQFPESNPPEPSPPEPSPTKPAPVPSAEGITKLLDRWSTEKQSALALNDYNGLIRHMSLYKELVGFPVRAANIHDPDVPALRLAIQELEERLFPFIDRKRQFKSIQSMRNSYIVDKGIVLTCGLGHFEFAYHTVRSIRFSVNSTLPIEVFYTSVGTAKDAENIKLLAQIPNLVVKNLNDFIDPVAVAVTTFAYKPYALMASSFKEAILIDADILFFQDPKAIFRFKGYQQTGIYLFRDRTTHNPGSKGRNMPFKMLRKLVWPPSEYVTQNSRVYLGLSDHEVDSGVVAIDKSKNFYELLLIALLNGNHFRGPLWSAFYGDKELFWIAFEMMRQPFYFERHGGGAAGYLAPDNGVCGGLFHQDDTGHPFWMNGGLVFDRHDVAGKTKTLNVTHWSTDITWTTHRWTWPHEGNPFCLYQDGQLDGQMGSFDGTYKEAAESNHRLWIEQGPMFGRVIAAEPAKSDSVTEPKP